MAEVVSSIFSGFLSRAFTPSVHINDSKIESRDKKKVITLEEVAQHDSGADCWIIIYDKVYDVTDFLDEHPGGRDLLLENAGREASGAFRSVGHSPETIKSLESLCVGELPMHESIFRKPGGLRLSDIPE